MTYTIHLANTPKPLFTSSAMTRANYWDHFTARMGIRR